MKNEAAQAAQKIRQELKKAFPGVRFTVKSKVYTGGDSIRIMYNDGPRADQVSEIVNKYEAGSFDGMQDLYEYNNSRDDIPQAKYIHVSRDWTDETRAELLDEIGRLFGITITDTVTEYFQELGGMSAGMAARREFAKRDLQQSK